MRLHSQPDPRSIAGAGSFPRVRQRNGTRNRRFGNSSLTVGLLLTTWLLVSGLVEVRGACMFNVGDVVRVKKTEQKAKIHSQGSLPLGRPDNTTYVVMFQDGFTSVTVLPEEIEPFEE